MKTFLQTDRIRLREFTPSDGSNLNYLDSFEGVRQYLAMPEPPTMEESEATVARVLAFGKIDPRYGYWVAEFEGAFVGWFHLRKSRTSDDIEVGYRLIPSAWGKGIATEGARGLLTRAFTEYEVPLVMAITMAANSGSRRVMEKLGMTLRRHFLYDDTYPSVEYAVRAEDFR